jgi:hypothetical protein
LFCPEKNWIVIVGIKVLTKTDPSPIRGMKHNILYDEEGDPLADTASHILKIFVHSNRGKYIGH